MRYVVLACDYDGTLARDGHVTDEVLTALERVRNSGRKLILVSGRELDDLQRTFSRLDLFDLAVLENGALLYNPATRRQKVLGKRPPDEFFARLALHGVAPVSAGQVIVATLHPHENTVLETIRELGLELQVIFNKGSVMVLPSGVNKASGLSAALSELNLSPHNVVAVGDAENDHAFLSMCECAVAVANALPALKEQADWVTAGDDGDGVIELIDHLLKDDLSGIGLRMSRHEILLGMRRDQGDDADEVRIKPYGSSLLVAGTSQGGKTTLTAGMIERLTEQGYQVCVIDPEGEYAELGGAVMLGDSNRTPRAEEVMELLSRPGENVVVNLLGVSLEQRPAFFADLFARLQGLRTRTGRPHWIVIDEAHHLLPSSWDPAPLTLAQYIYNLMIITLLPDRLSKNVLSLVDIIAAVGEEPEQAIRLFCEAIGESPPTVGRVTLAKGEALVWARHEGGEPLLIRSEPPHAERRRHHRKYAEGELAPERSFYFRGPQGKLNLRARNLLVFVQIAEGIDDETWLYHLHRGEYSRWFREHIKDEKLAREAAGVEADISLSPIESRTLIKQAIEKRYTAPA